MHGQLPTRSDPSKTCCSLWNTESLVQHGTSALPCACSNPVFSANNRTKLADRCVRVTCTHQPPVSPSFLTTDSASKLLPPQDDLELSPRGTVCRKSRWFLSELVHETGFQLSHVNADPPHTFEWHSLQVQKNKHVALLMFMELEPRGAPIGRSRGKISQSKRASISGKLLLIYLASSETIGFSGKNISLILSPEKKE